MLGYLITEVVGCREVWMVHRRVGVSPGYVSAGKPGQLPKVAAYGLESVHEDARAWVPHRSGEC